MFQTHSPEVESDGCEILVRGEYGDAKALIKRSTRAKDLKEKFKVKEMSSISTLEVAWENKSLWPISWKMKHISAVEVAKTNKLELLKWATRGEKV